MGIAADTTEVIGVCAFVGTALAGPDRRWLAGRQRPSPGGDRGRPDRATVRLRMPIRSVSTADRPGGWAGARQLGSLVVTRQLDQGMPPRGRLVLGRVGRQVVAAERSQSVIVFGPTQSHKTSGFAVPAILGWDGPVLATSVKTDLIAHTVDHRRECGTVAVFDPSGATGLTSATWSPWPASRTWPGARRAASALTEVAKSSVGTMSDGDFWYATAARMLAPLLFAAACGGGDMGDVIRWVETDEEDEVMDLLARSGVTEAVQVARSMFAKEERQRSSITTTVESVLEAFADGPGADGETSSSRSVDPRSLIAGSNTLYLCAPAHDQRRLTPLFVSVVREVLEHVYDRVAATGHPIDPPLLVVLDEAANIAPLHDLDALAATAAGHGVQLVTVWHDLAQITARFGPRATTVVNNHRAKLFLSGISDPSTLEYASRLIGDEEVVVPSTTDSGRSGASTTRSPTLRPLAPPDRLRRIAPGHGVLVYGDRPPARLVLRTWFADPWLRRRAGQSGAGQG
jgi:type IV secretion system protein VirD4